MPFVFGPSVGTVPARSPNLRLDEGLQAANRKGCAAMTMKTYCGNQVCWLRALAARRLGPCGRKKNAGRGDLSAFRVSALISCQTTTIAHACVLLSFYRLRPSVSAASAERARMTTPFLLCPAERAVLCRRCCANLRSSSAEAPSVRPDIGTSLSTVDSLANPRVIG